MSKYITIKEEDPTTSDALKLMNELSNVLESIAGSSGRSSFNLSDVCGQRSIFVVARDDNGKTVGCGAIH